MSLEIRNEFAASFARHSWSLDNWQVLPEEIAGVAVKWWSKFSEEHPNAFVTEYYQENRPEWTSRAIFNLFFQTVEVWNHVHIPKEVQKAAIQEYLED